MDQAPRERCSPASEPGSSGCCRLRPANRRRPSWATRSTTPTGVTPSRPAWPSTSSCGHGGRRCSGPRPGLPPAATAGPQRPADPRRAAGGRPAGRADRPGGGRSRARGARGGRRRGRVGVGRRSLRGARRCRHHPREEQASEEDDDEPAQSQAWASTSSVTTEPGSRVQSVAQDGHHSSRCSSGACPCGPCGNPTTRSPERRCIRAGKSNPLLAQPVILTVIPPVVRLRGGLTPERPSGAVSVEVGGRSMMRRSVPPRRGS
jgi:hypothetical protein